MQVCRVATIVIAAVALVGCQTAPPLGATAGGCKPLGGNSNAQNAAIGAVAGAVVGAAIGGAAAKRSSVGVRNGLLIGALGGALAGSQYNSLIGMTELADGSVRLNVPGSVMFRSGSAEISPAFATTLDSVASTIREYCGLTSTIVGHTDNTGTPEGNRRLSTDRARSVAGYLVSRGVDASRLQQFGRGQDEPLATNATDAGRAQNRRVEIFVRPPA